MLPSTCGVCSTSCTPTNWGISYGRSISQSHRERRMAHRLLALASSNGNGSDSDINLLKAQFNDLSSLLRSQQQTIEEQQQTIESLRSPISRHPLIMSGGETGPGWRASNRATSTSVSPFDSQRIGIGDRRLLGLFDSRFHSTSRYVIHATMHHACSHALFYAIRYCSAVVLSPKTFASFQIVFS